MRLAFTRIAADVAAGDTLAVAFQRAGADPALAVVVHTGEKSGTLPATLSAFAKAEQEAGEHALRLLVRASTTAFILGVFVYLGWRSFAQVTEVRESLERLLDVDVKGLAPSVTDGLKELQQALDQ